MAQNRLILAVETSSRIGSVAVALGRQVCGERTFSTPLRHSAELFPAIRHLLTKLAKKPADVEHIYVSAGPGSFTGLRIAVTMAKLMHLASAAKIVAVDTLDVIAANVTDYIGQMRSDARGDAPTFPSKTLHPDARPQPLYCRTGQTQDLPETIATVLDAKRGQFFIAVYQCRPPESPTPDQSNEHQPTTIRNRDAEYEIRDIHNQLWRKAVPDSLMTASEFVEQFAGGDTTIWLLGDGLLYHKDRFRADRIRFLSEQYWSPRAAKLHMLGWQKARAGEFANPGTLTPNYLLRPDIRVKRR